ncbi:transporter [Priestia aryabhattai]|uniref:transporter n=1 Tax=Priestia TaxID=2800373 RepID=UPI000BA02FC3|nr:transporter [Priestia aryabhattai]USY53951.1 transporter [Bacillus sp. 1780r2a1]
MYRYYYDPRFQIIFPGQGGQGFPPRPPGQGGSFLPPPPPPPGQGGAPGFPPSSGQSGPPTGPPPAFTPQLASSGGPSLYAVDPGSIAGCLYKYTYIWAKGGRSYWFYPTYVGRKSVAGYRWTGFNWIYAGIDLDRVNEFQCY